MPHVKAVITDLDGVIFDSFREGLRRIQRIAAHEEIVVGRQARRKLTEIWGKPGIELLQEGLDINRSLAEELYRRWEREDQAIPPSLVPGTRSVLRWLRRNGFKTALLTSRYRTNVETILDRYDLLREFAIITTREEVHYAKPDPNVFRATFAHLQGEFGIESEHCVYVGDTPSDIQAGHAADIMTLVVQTGPYFLKHTKQYPVDLEHLLESIEFLPLWLEEYHDGDIAELFEPLAD